MEAAERPSKREAFVALLKEGWTSLYLDARRPGVIVPAHLRGEPHLVLQYGYDLPIPIPDLEVDDAGVRATLSFSQTPHRTVVPWSAVYVIAAHDGRGVLYQEDVPDEVQVMATPIYGEDGRPLGPGDGTLSGELAADLPPRISPRAASGVRHTPKGPLRAVSPDESLAVTGLAADRPSPTAWPRPALRLVK